MKQKHNFEKKMKKNMLKKLNWQKKKSLKNDFINVKINEMLFSIIKQVVKKKQRKAEEK